MSHVTDISDVEIRDLNALERACKKLGLELVRDKKTYKWFGMHVGDYPLPKGFTKDDMGKCDHAIRLPGNDRAYEIGVVKRRDGKPGYTLHFDFWNKGYGMQNVAGQGACNVLNNYSSEIVMQAAMAEGMLVTGSSVKADGSIELLFQTQ